MYSQGIIAVHPEHLIVHHDISRFDVVKNVAPNVLETNGRLKLTDPNDYSVSCESNESG